MIDRVSKDLNFYFDAGHMQSGDDDFYQLLRNHFRGRDGLDEHTLACRALANGLTYANSIDQHLDAHTDDEKIKLCGKTAIVYQILKAERESALRDNPETGEPDLAKQELNNSWYPDFARMLFQGVRRTDIANLFKNISIICFNYDRCIERFLPYAISAHYRIDLIEAQDVARHLNIVHPYGTLGSLPDRGSPHGIQFGAPPRNINDFDRSSRIKTFTEQVEDEKTLAEIRSLMAEAKTLVFMGFGFLSDNLRLLECSGRSEFPRVYATAHNISNADREEIETDLCKLFMRSRGKSKYVVERDKIKIKNLTCEELLSEFWRSLQV